MSNECCLVSAVTHGFRPGEGFYRGGLNHNPTAKRKGNGVPAIPTTMLADGIWDFLPKHKMFIFTTRLVHLQNTLCKVEYEITIIIIIIIMLNAQGVQQELQGAHQGPHEDSRNGVRGKAIFLRPVWGEVIRLEKSFEISVTLI